MDLIYADADREDLGVLKDYKWDLAYGKDENNFTCEVALQNNKCKEGFYLYMDGTEYGGIVDTVTVDTGSDTLTCSGRTWHGILESKIIQPDAGMDYLTLSGDAHTVLRTLINRLGLSDLFRVATGNSGIQINYKMDRYIKAYTGIRKMLRASGSKLKLSYDGAYVELAVVSVTDYSADEQFDTDQISFKVSKDYHPINHMICLGTGELKDRMVVHLYTDAKGNISGTQTMTGLQEICETYDYANAESREDLIKGGTEKLQEAWGKSTIDYDFEAGAEAYDIGDIIGAVERSTGIAVRASITKKIVTVSNGTVSIDYDSEAMTGTVDTSEC